MTFKLGGESRRVNGPDNVPLSFNKDTDASISGTPIYRKDLDKGIKAEANMDGSIYISNTVEPGSAEERQILMHEMQHVVDMKVGKLAYTDDDITWMGEKYERKNGKIKYFGNWIPEGDKSFPWEQH